MKSSGKLNLLKNSSWTNVKDKSCITSRINYETLSNIICIEFELFRMFAHWIKHTGNFYRKCTWKYLKALLKCFNCNKNAWNFTYTRKEIKEKKKPREKHKEIITKLSETYNTYLLLHSMNAIFVLEVLYALNIVPNSIFWAITSIFGILFEFWSKRI